MNRLPPLAAMRAFEAVGRTGSVREAAEELGVSSGAITQHVHALETHLGIRLVQRNGRGIELTAQGRLYLPHLTAGFAELRTAHDQLEISKRSSHLLISTYPSLATKWLGPLMFAWKKQHPTASATISGVHPEPALEAGEADFRISYGNRHRFHSRYTYLFTDRLIVVASPALLARAGPLCHPRDLLTWPLLWVDWGSEYLVPPTWDEWFANAGVEVHKLRRDLVFSFPAAAVDAAIEAQGFALAQHSVVASALALGTLVHVLPPELPLPEAHFLAWSGTALEKPMGAAFHSWILNEAKRFDRRV
jgi:LysR family transcriptional regulator, glycine cleavage system transcriptional activator